jgi:endo-1,4-beta-xylanase
MSTVWREFPPKDVPADHVYRASGQGLTCALTFDDGPNGADTVRLLDFLAERDILAVFAVVGECIEAPGGADVLRRIVADGHVLCNHSTSFADMGDMDAADVRADLVRNLEIIRGAVGDIDVPYWRAPNGSWGVTEAVAADLGMRPLAVVNHIGDWLTQDVDVLAGRLRAVATPGQIVLAHDGGGDRSGTVAAVELVVDELLAAGWVFTLPAS